MKILDIKNTVTKQVYEYNEANLALFKDEDVICVGLHDVKENNTLWQYFVKKAFLKFRNRLSDFTIYNNGISNVLVIK